MLYVFLTFSALSQLNINKWVFSTQLKDSLTNVQLISPVWLFTTLWAAAYQASLSFTLSWRLLKLMSIESVMPSNHLILCHSFSSCPQYFLLSECFPWVSSSQQVAKVSVLHLQHQSFQWIFRVDFPWDWLLWAPCSPRDPEESFPEPQFKRNNYLVFSLLYNLTLTSVHDYQKNHRFAYTQLFQQSDVSGFYFAA